MRTFKSNERSEDSYIGLANFFSQESLKILMHLGIMLFLSSIENHLLKVTQIALSKYKRGNGAKKRERDLISKVEFSFENQKKNYQFIQFSQIGLMLSKSADHKSF